MKQNKLRIKTIEILKNFAYIYLMCTCGETNEQLSQALKEEKIKIEHKFLSYEIYEYRVSLTRSIRECETSIDFVQDSPGSRRDWVN